MMTGEPLEAIRTLNGKIWRRAIEKHSLEQYQRDLAVISTKLVAGRTMIHVLSDQRPDESFEPVVTSLEDVYFSTLHNADAKEKAA
jgi:ABC-2 type transport system ATP-binding protein